MNGDPILKEVARAIRSIRYGTVQLVIHDSRVVQIEKTEKVRLDKADQTAGDCQPIPFPTHQIPGGSDLYKRSCSR
ncbi:MAG: YezD family protein [Candidatus Omnitrophica bacterium]|nr:YezD family protein [Candidatus Omnitrophota bacterium]